MTDRQVWPQPGFVVVLERLPDNISSTAQAREHLLDVFRDTADYWADRRSSSDDASILFQ